MTQPQGSETFLSNDSDFLWFCLTCRESGIPASQRLSIRDEVLGLDIDNAVTLRLFKFDNDKDADNRKFWVRLVGGEVEDDVLDATEISSHIRNDPYADKHTEGW